LGKGKSKDRDYNKILENNSYNKININTHNNNINLDQTFNKNVNSPNSFYNFSFNNSRIIDNSGNKSLKSEGKNNHQTEYFPTINKLNLKENNQIQNHNQKEFSMKNNNNDNIKYRGNSKENISMNLNNSRNSNHYNINNLDNSSKYNKNNNNYTKVRTLFLKKFIKLSIIN
jgi:hypothetical protein